MPVLPRPVYLLADSRPLFSRGDGRSFAGTIAELVRDFPAAAAYIGASNGDDPNAYAIFEAAMDAIGVRDRRMIEASYPQAAAEYLRSADIILLAGGDPARGWRAMQETGMVADLLDRHASGAIFIGVSAGAVLLGQAGWQGDHPGERDVFDALGLVPWIVDVHDEADDWDRLRRVMTYVGPHARGIGIPSGGGAMFHPDGALEPLRRPVSELTMVGGQVTPTLVLPLAGDDAHTASPDDVS